MIFFNYRSFLPEFEAELMIVNNGLQNVALSNDVIGQTEKEKIAR